MNVVHDFFGFEMINVSLNETYICLIPKKKDPKVVSDYRSIIIILCAYKVTSWVLLNRLKHVLSSTINLNKLASVEDRQILDVFLVANELVAWKREWCDY